MATTDGLLRLQLYLRKLREEKIRRWKGGEWVVEVNTAALTFYVDDDGDDDVLKVVDWPWRLWEVLGSRSMRLEQMNLWTSR